MSEYSFRLYVAGKTARSTEAEVNLQSLCEPHLRGRYEFETVDAVERPDRAEEERILATPTVVWLAPPPVLLVIEDLSDQSRAAAFLGLPDADGASAGRQA